MPKAELVIDEEARVSPLRVWRRQARGRMAPRIRVKCGCCDQYLNIFTDDPASGDPSMDTLEIGGVMGTVDQWRKILLPLLGVEAPKQA